MNKLKEKNILGFTIIEVVLVLAIAGLIFLIVFLAVPALQKGQRDTQRRSDMGRLMSQLSNYQANNQGKVPTNQAELTTNATSFQNRYLTISGEQFKDPLTGNDYSVVFQGTVANSPANVGDVYYYYKATCNGDIAQASASNRAVAIVTPLERGGNYCQGN
jgi:type II secretory pathway pseudopilin PulG